jgi:hypothetical protein
MLIATSVVAYENALLILQYRLRIFLVGELLWIKLCLEVEWEYL